MKAINPSELWKKRLGDWVLNPYIGCEHGCKHCYCPAMPGVKFFNGGRPQEDWGKYLIAKDGWLDAVKRQLVNFTPEKAKRTEWGDGWLLMSFLTDCYTHTEGKLKLTRETLKLLLEAGHKVRVQTRSAMVERDFDILKAHRERVLLGTSLPYLDDPLARVLEPGATSPSRRLVMLERAVEAGLEVFVAVAPVMPWTPPHDFIALLLRVMKLQPREIFCEVLNPKGCNLDMMLHALIDASSTGSGTGVPPVGRPTRSFRPESRMLMAHGPEDWAARTYDVLSTGVRESNYGVAHVPRAATRFIPWPDTQRGWARHLNAEQCAFLDQYLPRGTGVPPVSRHQDQTHSPEGCATS